MSSKKNPGGTPVPHSSSLDSHRAVFFLPLNLKHSTTTGRIVVPAHHTMSRPRYQENSRQTPKGRRSERQGKPYQRPEKYLITVEIKDQIRALAGYKCTRCGISEDDLIERISRRCDTCTTMDTASEREAEKACQNCVVTKTPLQIHHRLQVYMADQLNLDPAVVSHPLAMECLCPNCHKQADREVKQMTEADVRRLFAAIQAEIRQNRPHSRGRQPEYATPVTRRPQPASDRRSRFEIR